MDRPARPLVRLAVLGAAVATLAGCAVGDPQALADTYAEPADGIQVRLTEGLRGENLIVFASEQGGEGQLTGALVNDTAEDVEFGVIVAQERMSVQVPARGSVILGVDEPAEIAAVTDPPGAMTQVTLATSSQGAVTARIPVLDGTLPPYEDLVP